MSRSSSRPGAYLSWPFCAQKCSYCNFASGVFPRSLEQDYLQALITEIRDHEWTTPPDTVYIGGGTPSQLDPAALGRILNAVPGKPWREATLEAAPGTITRDKARQWRAAGIDRVSLGVQSFVKAELQRTGRKHDAATVAGDCSTLLECGIENINIDLIAGLPHQTAASWAESLEWIERIAPPHVSVYLLEVDEDSRLGLEILNNGSRYGAGEVPADDLMAELYETAVQRLRSAGINRYEISNFARPGSESLHNLKYWQLETYAGFGVDAHGFDGVERFANTDSTEDYIERWRRRESRRVETTQANVAEERFFVSLRLAAGIRPEQEEWSRFREPIARAVERGLLERDGASLRLTSQGVLLSNEVFQDFVAV